MELKISHGLILFGGQAPPSPPSTPVAPSGKVCVVTSVASFLVLGGARPPIVPTKKFTYTARASEASERLRNIYFQDSKYICLHIQSMHFPLLMVWRYKPYYTDKTLKLRKTIYEYASELRKFSHFHMLKLLFPSIFSWYFRYFVSETFSLYHLYDIIYKRQYTDKAVTLRKCICAIIERSERA